MLNKISEWWKSQPLIGFAVDGLGRARAEAEFGLNDPIRHIYNTAARRSRVLRNGFWTILVGSLSFPLLAFWGLPLTAVAATAAVSWASLPFLRALTFPKAAGDRGRGPSPAEPNGRNNPDPNPDNGPRPSDGRTPDGRTPDPQTPDGRTPDPQTPDGRTPDPQTPDGRTPDPQTPDVGTPGQGSSTSASGSRTQPVVSVSTHSDSSLVDVSERTTTTVGERRPEDYGLAV